MQVDQYQLRTFESKGMLRDYLKKIHEATDIFLSALKGFHRDFAISQSAHPKYIRAEFSANPLVLAVPPLMAGADFADLSKMMLIAEDTLDGTIKISFPWIVNQDERKKIVEEMEIIHQNLMRVSDTAMQVHNLIQTACMEFDMFNGKNGDVGYTEANIAFDRDALNVSMETARALSERAVRFDIDIISKKESVS